MKKLICIAFLLPLIVQAQENSNTGKEPYCIECDEIKKIKKEQWSERFSSRVSDRKKKKNFLQHIYFRTSKKMNRIFGKRKKKKQVYSCFVW